VPLGQGELAPLNWIFNSETVAVGGSGSAVQANAGNPDRPFRVIFGASQRLVADLADLSRSLAANSTGQTSQPFHRHREDQVPLWRDVEYHPVVTRREALDEASSSTLILQPGEAPE
jgi:penicillin amidase